MTSLPIRRRHGLDPARVLDCVERKVADHLRFHEYRLAEAEKSLAAYEAADARGRRLWTRKPELPSKTLVDDWVKTEREYYALVPVLWCCCSGPRSGRTPASRRHYPNDVPSVGA